MWNNRDHIISTCNELLIHHNFRKIYKFGNKKLHKDLFIRQNNQTWFIMRKDYKPYGNSPVNDAIALTLPELEQDETLTVVSDFNDNGSKINKEQLSKLTTGQNLCLVKIGD